MSTALNRINMEIFRKYAGLSLPRHVSYPMPTAWYDMDASSATDMLMDRRRGKNHGGLSLYLHVPFCERLCMYCACTRVIQPKSSARSAPRTEAYVAALQGEVEQWSELLDGGDQVRQIHWGGGTPTYLEPEALAAVHATIERAFKVSPDAEIAMEIDPRVADRPMLAALRQLGIERVSLGVQDFDEQVQKHVRRVQSVEMIRDVVQMCRELGFASINFDLIYGLPYQTPETIADTVAKTIQFSPDRIAFYHYAQIPEKIATQRGLDYSRLPDSETKLAMFLSGLRLFEEAGYRFIGLDHFAKKDEALAIAAEKGTLQRNFQGMTTGGGLDLIGIGASSISHLLETGFLQNIHDVDSYIVCVDEGATSVRRGKRFTLDDRIRQEVLSQLYCNARIDPAAIEEQFNIDFRDYFADQLAAAETLAADGLVVMNSDGGFEVTRPLGRVLMRNVAAVFDAYLAPDAYRVGDQRCFSASA